MILPPEPKTKRIKSNPNTSIENNEDRLSDLSDSIIHHILSFLDTKVAFKTCILSTRWKNLTKYLPTLRLSSAGFNSYNSFIKSMSRVLSFRDDSTALHTLDLYCPHPQDVVRPKKFERIVNYAVSHNVQRLRISVSCDIQQLPSCLFSSQTLTSLDLSIHYHIRENMGEYFFPSSLNLPVLTTLTLTSLYFRSGDDGCVEPFSALNKLNTLIIQHCRVPNEKILCISSTTLVNLTMHGIYDYQQKCKLELSAPSLSNFAFTGTLRQKLYLRHRCSVTHLYINAHPIGPVPQILLTWLQEFVNIKSLTLSADTLQVLALVPDLFKVKLTSMCNLESLRVEKKRLRSGFGMVLRTADNFKLKNEFAAFHLNKHKFIPDGVLEFLLQNSPLAKVITS